MIPSTDPKPAPRLKLVAPVASELELHEACVRLLDQLLAPPAIYASYPAGHIKLAPRDALKLIRVGLKRSLPDLLVFHHKVFGIELKRPGAALSKTRVVRTRRGAPRELIGQADMFPKLMQTGAFGDIAIVTSCDELLQRLQAWHIPLRGYLGV
jgi:hypothetical protein